MLRYVKEIPASAFELSIAYFLQFVKGTKKTVPFSVNILMLSASGHFLSVVCGFSFFNKQKKLQEYFTAPVAYRFLFNYNCFLEEDYVLLISHIKEVVKEKI